MSQDFKKKFFSHSSTQEEIEEIIAYAEEEIEKESISEELKADLLNYIRNLEEVQKLPCLLFEDSGAIYGIMDSICIYRKVKTVQ